MKIKKSMFKSLKGLKELKQMKKTGYCNGIECSRCPLGIHNRNDNMENCADIIDLDGYVANDFEEIKKMDKLIDIFTKEKINSILPKLAPNRNLKYNDYVVYDDKVFKIKGVLNKKEIFLGIFDSILLSGYDNDYTPEYSSCIVAKKAMEKEYTLWVDPSEIFALNDVVTERQSNMEYKIVAIYNSDNSNYPILLNDHNSDYFSINDMEEGDILCSIPEAHKTDYSKWVSSHNIKHK